MTAPVNNEIVPVSMANLASITWNINWDTLFKGANKKYTNCRLRFTLKSDSWAGGANDWENYSGYLSVNLGSNNNASTTTGLFLGQIYPFDVPSTNANRHAYIIGTMEELGVDIFAPTGSSYFTIQFINDDAQTLITAVPNYAITFQFEFYNQSV